MRKKLSVILIVLTLAFVMSGCNSEVYLYYFPDGEEAYYALDIKMDNTELKFLEDSAKKGAVYPDYHMPEFKSLSGNFTFERYIISYMATFNFKYVGVENGSGYTNYMFQTVDPVPFEDDELRHDTVMTEKPGLFFNYYNFETLNPMTAFRKKYDETTESGSSPMAILKKGWTDRTVVSESNTERIFELESTGWTKKEKDNNTPAGNIEYSRKMMPSFAEAFPAAESDKTTFDPNKLKVNFLLQTDSKMSGADDVLYDSEGHKYYLYKELFLDNNSVIQYQMRRANTVAWNILSIALGFAAVGGVIIAAHFLKNNKNKPKKTNTIADFADRLPYNPNDTNNDNPFSGY